MTARLRDNPPSPLFWRLHPDHILSSDLVLRLIDQVLCDGSDLSITVIILTHGIDYDVFIIHQNLHDHLFTCALISSSLVIVTISSRIASSSEIRSLRGTCLPLYRNSDLAY
jgi:hypothetical protein